jgi:hypothetical protein
MDIQVNQSLYTISGLPSALIGKKCMPPPKEEDFPATSYKWGDYDFVMKNTTDYVREILSSINVFNLHKYVLVDIKVHDLKKDDVPALPFWHIDCTPNPIEEPVGEIHNLFISSDVSATQFLSEDRTVYVPDKGRVNWDKVLGLACKVRPIIFSSIKPLQVYTYSEHLHRATPAIRDGKRLFIRLTETSKYIPSNKPFKVTIT